MSTMRYEVQFRREYTEPAPQLTEFDDAHEALAYASSCVETADGTRLPYYMIRIHDRQASEWLSIPQLAFILEGGMIPRTEP
jgi:hypothetical protein